MYVSDSQGFYRRFQKPTGGRTSFTTATKLKVLLCPTETATPISNGGSPSNNVADAAPRSYFINGWNDYFNDTLSAGDFANYMNGIYPTGLKESLIAHASDTIILGEKLPTRMILHGSAGKWWQRCCRRFLFYLKI
jgi:hypothetical protein